MYIHTLPHPSPSSYTFAFSRSIQEAVEHTYVMSAPKKIRGENIFRYIPTRPLLLLPSSIFSSCVFQFNVVNCVFLWTLWLLGLSLLSCDGAAVSLAPRRVSTHMLTFHCLHVPTALRAPVTVLEQGAEMHALLWLLQYLISQISLRIRIKQPLTCGPELHLFSTLSKRAFSTMNESIFVILCGVHV